MCSESSNTAKAHVLFRRARLHSCREARWRPLIVDSHLAPDQHQKLTLLEGQPVVHACHVWSTSVNACVSYPAHRQADEQTTERTII